MEVSRPTLLLLCISLVNAPAAVHCVSVAGAGSKTGADWNNSFQASLVTYVRGDSYYFAAGTYTALNLTTAVSGTNTIWLYSATVSSHGVATGWSDGLAGTAAFGESDIGSPYWCIDGQTRGADWRSSYGFKFSSAGNQALYLDTDSGHITLRYIEFAGKNTASVDDFGIQSTSFPVTNLTISYCYFHETGNSFVQMNAEENRLLTVEYCWFYKNHRAQDATHDEGLAIVFHGMTCRYSYFQDCGSTACIADPAGWTPTVDNWAIYGCVFFWDSAWQSDAENVGLDNGIVGLPNHDASSGTFYFYNNTIYGIRWTGGGGGPLCNSGVDSPEGGATRNVYNNLWYQCDSPTCAYPNYDNYDYNSYYACGSEGVDVGAHKFVTATASNIFVLPGSFNFRLNYGTTAGLTQSSPYNADMDGNTRGADGTWDRGAYEYQTGGSTPTRAANAVTVHVGTMTQPAP